MKLRIRHTKLGKVRFTSHRDSARHWERAMRKAGLRVATTGGFTPRPRMSFGLALPTGAESFAEYLDVDFVDEGLDAAFVGGGLGVDFVDGDRDVDDVALRRRMTDALPAGYEVTRVARDAGRISLQEDVVACSWRITLSDVGPAEADDAIGRLLGSTELALERERKGQRRTDDVRPAVEQLALDVSGVTAAGSPVVVATLSTRQRGLRPVELVQVLCPGRDPLDVAGRIVRTHQWIERAGERSEVLPLTVGARPAPGAAA